MRVAFYLRGHGRGRGSWPWVTRNCGPRICRLERNILNRRGRCRLSSALLRRPLRTGGGSQGPPSPPQSGREEHPGASILGRNSKSEICASERNTREQSTSENHKPRLVPAATERLGTGTPPFGNSTPQNKPQGARAGTERPGQDQPLKEFPQEMHPLLSPPQRPLRPELPLPVSCNDPVQGPRRSPDGRNCLGGLQLRALVPGGQEPHQCETFLGPNLPVVSA